MLLMVFVLWLILAIIKAIIHSATNVPSWSGVIISALLGMLPFYLFMCWMGWMGDERNN